MIRRARGALHGGLDGAGWRSPPQGDRRVWSEDAIHLLQPTQEVYEAAAERAVNPTWQVRGHAELEARVTSAYEDFVATGQMAFRARGGAKRLGDVVTWRWKGSPRMARCSAPASSSWSSPPTAGSRPTTSSSSERDDDGRCKRRHARGRALRRRGGTARPARGRHDDALLARRALRALAAAGATSCATTCAIAASRRRSTPRRPRTPCATSPPTRRRLPARSTTGRRTSRGSASAGWSPRSPRSTTRTRSRRSPWPARGRSRPARSTMTCPTMTRRR